MSVLRILHTTNFDSAMDNLRIGCFPGTYRGGTSREEFDDRSFYPLIYIDYKLAAYARLTPGPDSVFESWTQGKAEIPTVAKVVDFGRALVAPEFRGLDLLRLLCLEALAMASDRGYSQVVGAVIPGRGLANMLYELGFKASGGVVEAVEPNKKTPIQPLILNVNGQFDHWIGLKQRFLAELEAKGFATVSNASATPVICATRTRATSRC